MNTRRLIAGMILAWIPLLLFSQPYEHSAGIRAGYSSGLTYKAFFLFRPTAIEVTALYNNHGFQAAALLEIHRELDRKGQFMAFAGGGLAVGQREDEFAAGLVAAAGLEYCLRRIPLCFGIDWKPTLMVLRTTNYDLFDLGLYARYRFKL